MSAPQRKPQMGCHYVQQNHNAMQSGRNIRQYHYKAQISDHKLLIENNYKIRIDKDSKKPFRKLCLTRDFCYKTLENPQSVSLQWRSSTIHLQHIDQRAEMAVVLLPRSECTLASQLSSSVLTMKADIKIKDKGKKSLKGNENTASACTPNLSTK